MNAWATFAATTAGAWAHHDIAIISSALAVVNGDLPVVPALAGCLLGGCTGDATWYSIGHKLGMWALTKPPIKWVLRPHRVDLAVRWFQRRGLLLLVTSRMFPGVGNAVQFAGGMLYPSFARGLIYLMAAGLVHTVALFGLTMWLGEGTVRLLASYQKYTLLALVLVGAGLWLLLSVVPRLLPSSVSPESALAAAPVEPSPAPAAPPAES